MPATANLFKKFLKRVFIETGSYRGDGIQLALDAGFEQVYSIELGIDLYINCTYRFAGIDKVHLLNGDSAVTLPSLLNDIDEPVTFWLDGHYSGGDTVLGSCNSPLLQELEAIKNHKIKTHTIMIDDLRCWVKEVHGFNTNDLIQKLEEINPDYSFDFEDGHVAKDILVAWMK
jgi:hypothetical protein